MANPKHLRILKQGVTAWNNWREEHPKIRPNLRLVNLVREDLRRVNFSNTDLSGARLAAADLRRANLKGANLSETDLRLANLILANLEGANLSGADLTLAYLSKANLIEADLRLTNLRLARLQESDMNNAIVGLTIFAGLDLRKARGLETVQHIGPSTIGIDTIYKSKGKIPSAFLRGAGVPEIFIKHMDSLLKVRAIQFYSCFISYSSEDELVAKRLYEDLQRNQVQVWYFPETAKWGEPVWGEIDRSIRMYDKLVVICSKFSLQSGPVLREIERALQREDKEGRNVLFPIRIDDYLFDEWENPRKADVVAKVVGDFRVWDRETGEFDEEKYQRAFNKLLKALQAEDHS